MTETKAVEKTEKTEKLEKVEKTEKAKPVAKTATKKVSKEEIMKKHLSMVNFVKNVISDIETHLKRVNVILDQLSKFDPENAESLESTEKDTSSNLETKAASEEA